MYLCRFADILVGGPITNAQRIAILQARNLYVAPKPRKKKNEQISSVASSNIPSALASTSTRDRQNESRLSRTTQLSEHTNVNKSSVTQSVVSQETFFLNEEVRNIHGLHAHITKVNEDGTYDVRCKLLYNIIINVHMLCYVCKPIC
jgi:hypothetical protein